MTMFFFCSENSDVIITYFKTKQHTFWRNNSKRAVGDRSRRVFPKAVSRRTTSTPHHGKVQGHRRQRTNFHFPQSQKKNSKHSKNKLTTLEQSRTGNTKKSKIQKNKNGMFENRIRNRNGRGACDRRGLRVCIKPVTHRARPLWRPLKPKISRISIVISTLSLWRFSVGVVS